VVIEKRINFAKITVRDNIHMINKNSILLLDPDFDPGTAADCTLLLKITTDSFSYAIIDKKMRRLKAIYDRQECLDTEQVLSTSVISDHYLMLPFKEVKASVFTLNSIALPNELFDVDSLKTFTKFFNKEQSDQLYVQNSRAFDLRSIFNLPVGIEKTFDSSFKNCKRYDHTAATLTMGDLILEDAVIIDFTVGSFHITYIKNRKLQFQNCFEIENSEEFNYYLLLLINQLNIDKLKTDAILSGIIHEDDRNYAVLTKYFPTVTLHDPIDANIDFSLLEDMPAHYYTSLLALDLCE
jgi:hypothetical protein